MTSHQPLDDELVVSIWETMIICYGHKWTSALGQAVDEKGYLSKAAMVYSRELAGLTGQDLERGFSRLRDSFPKWYPSLFEFLDLCMAGEYEAVPTIDQIARALATVSCRSGSLQERYQYALAYAISRQPGIDMFYLRTSSYEAIKAAITPAYRYCLNNGWPDFPEIEKSEFKALSSAMVN